MGILKIVRDTVYVC